MAGTLNSSKQQFGNVRTNMPEVLKVLGTIQTNGAAPVRIAGRGYTVTQQGTGLYRVTMNINTTRIVAVQSTLVKAATSQTFLEIQDMTAGNNYVTFRIVNNAGTAVAPGALTDSITFIIAIMTVRLPVT